MTDLSLPQHVSNDGREIWDWAARLSHRTALIDRRAKLANDLFKLSRECGSCRFWMTNDCPREVHDNSTGRKRGPSMGAPICQQFVMGESEARLKAKWEAELAEVRAQLAPKTEA